MTARLPPRNKTSSVPESRLNRLLQFGRLAGGMVAGTLAEGVRQTVRGEPLDRLAAVLSPANATRLAERLSKMRGAAMKIGQLLSLEAKELIPEEFSQVLAVLRSQAHHMPFSQLIGMLEQEWGQGWDQRFERFHFAPMAAASIGQVHEARMRDGRHTAVKIQYPGIRRSIDSDVENAAALFRLLQLLPGDMDLRPILNEAKQQLHREADYFREADMLIRYGALIRDEQDFALPEVVRELTTEHILVMDFMQGVPIESLAGAGHSQADRNRAGELLMRLLFRELFEFGLVQTDPNFANYFFDTETRRIVLLDFGATRQYEPQLLDKYRDLFRAARAGDRDRVEDAIFSIGFLEPSDPLVQREGFVELMLRSCEPIRQPGPYDFRDSQLVRWISERGYVLRFELEYNRLPPAETIFLHRKLAGMYLLCAQMGAKIDLGRLIEPFLDS